MKFEVMDGCEWELERQQEEIDKLTRMLCALCGKVDKHRLADWIIEQADEELTEWWREHQKMDEARLEKKKIEAIKETNKQKALGKLTAEDKKY